LLELRLHCLHLYIITNDQIKPLLFTYKLKKDQILPEKFIIWLQKFTRLKNYRKTLVNEIWQRKVGAFRSRSFYKKLFISKIENKKYC